MAQFKAYPKYKDSGVEWLGEVPEHWGSCKLKYIAKVYAGGTPDRNRLDFWSNGNIPWINSGAVNQIDISEPSEYITELGFNLSSAKYIPKNSLVIALAGQGKTKGMVAYTSIETTCNQSMAAIVTHNYYFKFLFYWLSANYQKIRNLTGGNNRDGLNLVILGDIVCPQINTSEQTQIANYLDKETSKIDTLIAKQEKLIELLKERIIALAMTEQIHGKGKLVRLCSVAHEVIRPVHLDDAADYVALGLYNRGRGLFHKPLTLGKDMGDSTFFYVDSGDLIISGQFAWEGAVAMASHNESGCVVSHRYPVIKGSVVDTMYLFALFMSDYGNFLLNDCSRGSAGRNRPLNKNILLKQKIRMPSDEVQKKIKDIFEKKQQLEININTTIEKLKEYRASVISHAVTGKIDVRELVA